MLIDAKSYKSKQPQGKGAKKMNCHDKLRPLKLHLQYFADEPEKKEEQEETKGKAGDKEKKTPDNPGKKKDGEDKKTYTKDEVEQMIQERLNRKGDEEPPTKGKDNEEETPPNTENEQDEQDEQGQQTGNEDIKKLQDELLISNARFTAMEKGVRQEKASDAVYLAYREAENAGEITKESVETGLDAVIKRNPEWCTKETEDQKKDKKFGAGGGDGEKGTPSKSIPSGTVII